MEGGGEEDVLRCEVSYSVTLSQTPQLKVAVKTIEAVLSITSSKVHVLPVLVQFLSVCLTHSH